MGIKPVGVGDDLPDAGGAGVKTAIEMLNGHRSWKLERISPTTSSGDLEPRYRQKSKWLRLLIQAGVCYRCRISRSEWQYAGTPEEAAAHAVDAFEADGGQIK